MVNVMKLGDSACLLELPSELTDPDEIPYLNACTLQCFAKNKWVILDFSAVQTMNGLGATMLVKLSDISNLLIPLLDLPVNLPLTALTLKVQREG